MRRPPPVPAPARRPRRAFPLAVVLGALLLTGCGTNPAPPGAPAPATGSSSAPAAGPAPGSGAAGTTTCSYPAEGEAAKPATPPPTTGVPARGTVAYTLAMTGGPVTLTLDRRRAPCTVNSFASLADQGYFDGTRCHRMLDSGIFILQCGDPTGTGTGGPGYRFADETTGHDTYTSGVVAMANIGPDTNGSQFFLIWSDSTSLDAHPDYTVFGRMDRASRDVVASMAGEGRDDQDRPINPSEITRVTRA